MFAASLVVKGAVGWQKVGAVAIGMPTDPVEPELEGEGLLADVCEDCGYVELRVANPRWMRKLHFDLRMQKTRKTGPG